MAAEQTEEDTHFQSAVPSQDLGREVSDALRGVGGRLYRSPHIQKGWMDEFDDAIVSVVPAVSVGDCIRGVHDLTLEVLGGLGQSTDHQIQHLAS